MVLRPVLHLVTRPIPNRNGQSPLSLPHPSIESGALLRGTRELLIRHGGETHRLRHTRNDKLILTK